MKILFVYPEYPVNFWSMKYSVEIAGKRVAFPPLGLTTVASMLPREWQKKLVDLNFEQLKDEQLQWADYVFLGAMDIQKKSAVEAIKRCNELGIKVVAGGPLFTEHYEDFENVDHLVLGEAEATLPVFLKDLESGSPKHLYMPGKWTGMEISPTPMWELADMRKYYFMGIQFSRGCPFDCEYCQITRLFGRKVRTKSKEQIIRELESIYNLGWRAGVMFVDDNLIGDKHKLKAEILPAIIEWMEKRDYPFWFFTQLSVNLADDEELMAMMVRAGFGAVFVGIETFDDDCLFESGKFHNRNRDLIENVKRMQRSGLEVWAGLIVGFDSDKENVFDRMVQFIQESGIVVVMMNILRALKGTKLYERLEKEGRLLGENTGDTVDHTTNFIPKMGMETLLEGHRKIVKGIYSPEPYYLRLRTFFKEFRPSKSSTKLYDAPYCVNPRVLKSLFRSIVILGILDKGRLYYWKLFFWSLLKQPKIFPLAIALAVQGYHFRKVFRV